MSILRTLVDAGGRIAMHNLNVSATSQRSALSELRARGYIVTVHEHRITDEGRDFLAGHIEPRTRHRPTAGADLMRAFYPLATTDAQISQVKRESIDMGALEPSTDAVKDSERALEMAREAGFPVDMTNNWPQTK